MNRDQPSDASTVPDRGGSDEATGSNVEPDVVSAPSEPGGRQVQNLDSELSPGLNQGRSLSDSSTSTGGAIFVMVRCTGFLTQLIHSVGIVSVHT